MRTADTERDGAAMTGTHWLFGDRLGPAFLAPGGDGPSRDARVVMTESRAALALVRSQNRVAVLPPRGFLVRQEDFATWARGQRVSAWRPSTATSDATTTS